MTDLPPARFEIRPEGGRWLYAVFGPDDRLMERGLVNSRAIAAACVIRVTTRSLDVPSPVRRAA